MKNLFYICLFILFVSRVTHSAVDCVPNYLNIQANYYTNFFYVTYSPTGLASLTSYGYNQTSITKTYAQGNLYFKIVEPKPIKFYFTHNVGGKLCNKTFIIDGKDYIPDITVIQPKCMFTNATFNFNPGSKFTFNTATVSSTLDDSSIQSSFPINLLATGSGAFSVSLDHFSTKIQITPQFSLVPNIRINATNCSKADGGVEVLNINDFTDIQLFNSTGELLGTRKGFFNLLHSGEYVLLLSSNICGLQSYVFTINTKYPEPIINILPDCQGSSSVKASFTLEGVDSQYTVVEFVSNTFNAGQVFEIPPGYQDIKFTYLAGYCSHTYSIYIPNYSLYALPMSYSFSEPLSCSVTSSVMFINYTRSNEDILVDGEPLSLNYRLNAHLGRTMNITNICSGQTDILVLSLPKPTYRAILDPQFIKQSCFSTYTIYVDNYNLFESVELEDTFNSITYNSNNGIFTNVHASKTLSIVTTNCTTPNEKTITPIDITIEDLSENDIEFNVAWDSTPQCGQGTGYFVPIVNGFGISGATTLVSFTYSSQDNVIAVSSDYYSCKGKTYSAPLPKPNLTKLSVSIPAVCQESYANVTIETSETINYIRGSNYIVLNNTSDNFFLTPTGSQTIEIGYESGCSETFGLDISYSRVNLISYNVYPQKVNDCTTASGRISFNNVNDFEYIKYGMTNGSTYDFGAGMFSFSFNHNVCGVGAIDILLPVEGTFETSTFVAPATNNNAGGLIKYSILDANGKQVKPLGISSGLFLYSVDNIIGDLSRHGYQNSYLTLGDFCMWNFNIPEYPLADGPITGVVTKQPAPLHQGIAELSFPTGSFLEIINPNYFATSDSKSIIGLDGENSIYFTYIENTYQAFYYSIPVNSIPLLSDNLTTVQVSCSSLQAIYQGQPDTVYIVNDGQHNVSSFTISANGGNIVYFKNQDGYVYKQQINLERNGFAPIPTVSVKNTSCLNSNDGSISISNPNYDYSYRLINADGDIIPEISQGTFSHWTGLNGGAYTIYIVNKYNPNCWDTRTVEVSMTEVTTRQTVVNQCNVDIEGTINISAWAGNQQLTNTTFYINDDQAINGTTPFPFGNYTIVGFVDNTACRTKLFSRVSIANNIITSKISSPSCGQISFEASSVLNSTFKVELLYKSNNIVVSTFNNIQSKLYENLGESQYYFRITEYSGCQITTDPISVQQCQSTTASSTTASSTTTTSSSTTGSDDINNSIKLLPSSSLYLLVILIATTLFFN